MLRLWLSVDETEADLGSLSGTSTRDLRVSCSLSELHFPLTARMNGVGGRNNGADDHLEVQMRFGYRHLVKPVSDR